MHGDFEAQRHWMEVTVHLPLGEWYRATARNNLQYWGLDYPPLSAYAAWAFGHLARFVAPSVVEWETSRGVEGPSERLFMRLTVLATDLLFYVPAVWLFVYQRSAMRRSADALGVAAEAAFLLLAPALLLVDHGHFQYNNVWAGLTLLSVVAVMQRAWLASALLLLLALNFKQTVLFYAPAFAVVFILVAWHGGVGELLPVFSSLATRASPTSKLGSGSAATKLPRTPGLASRAAAFFALACVGATVFAALWSPFCLLAAKDVLDCTSVRSAPPCTCVGGLQAVLHRLFPFNRGLFEDKVSNLWCALEPVLHLRARVSGDATGAWRAWAVAVASGLTAVLMAPTVIALLWRPSRWLVRRRGGGREGVNEHVIEAVATNSTPVGGPGGADEDPPVSSSSSSAAAGNARRRGSSPSRDKGRSRSPSPASPSLGRTGVKQRRGAASPPPPVAVASLATAGTPSVTGDLTGSSAPPPWAPFEILLLAAFNTSTAFFLAGFQTHEKAILLPLLPLMLLRPRLPGMAAWAAVAFTWSMWPMLGRDGLGVPAVVLCAALGALHLQLLQPLLLQGGHAPYPRAATGRGWGLLLSQTTTLLTSPAAARASLFIMGVLAAAGACVAPPAGLPDLFPYLSAAAMAGMLTAVLLGITTPLLWGVAAGGEADDGVAAAAAAAGGAVKRGKAE